MPRSIGKWGIKTRKKMYKWMDKKICYNLKVYNRKMEKNNECFIVELVLQNGEAVTKTFKTEKSAINFFTKEWVVR